MRAGIWDSVEVAALCWSLSLLGRIAWTGGVRGWGVRLGWLKRYLGSSPGIGETAGSRGRYVNGFKITHRAACGHVLEVSMIKRCAFYSVKLANRQWKIFTEAAEYVTRLGLVLVLWCVEESPLTDALHHVPREGSQLYSGSTHSASRQDQRDGKIQIYIHIHLNELIMFLTRHIS